MSGKSASSAAVPGFASPVPLHEQFACRTYSPAKSACQPSRSGHAAAEPVSARRDSQAAQTGSAARRATKWMLRRADDRCRHRNDSGTDFSLSRTKATPQMAPAAPGDASRASVRQQPDEVRRVVEGRRAAELNARGARLLRVDHVDLVERLDLVRDEAERHHQHLPAPLRRERAQRLGDLRGEPLHRAGAALESGPPPGTPADRREQPVDGRPTLVEVGVARRISFSGRLCAEKSGRRRAAVGELRERRRRSGRRAP